jgi:hypothetical protein
MNAIKKRPKHKKMMSAGHVSGFGLSTKVGVHFKEDSKTRKERRSKVEEAQRREIADLKEQVARCWCRWRRSLKQGCTRSSLLNCGRV